MSILPSKLYVISPVSNTRSFVGITHSHAIKYINGSAIFGFRDLSIASRLSYAVDNRIINGEKSLISEDILYPSSQLELGQNVTLTNEKYSQNKLYNIQIGKVDEQELLSYCAALHISCVIFGYSPQKDSIYVKEIVSPPRSFSFSAGYLDYLYNKDENEVEF